MEKHIWFPLYANDFLASSKIAMMSTEEIGAYILLLCHAWQDPQCSLPLEEEALKRLGRISMDISRVRDCFEKKSGRLINKRLLKEWEKVQHNKEKASKAALQRWHPSSNANAYANALHPQCSSPSPSHLSYSSPVASATSKETKEVKTPLATLAGPTPSEILALWNGTGLHPCKNLGERLKKRLATVLKDHPDPVWWQDLFARIAASDFLAGRKTDWTATLDWSVGPKNLAKILAGNYDENVKPSPTKNMIEKFLQGGTHDS